MIKFRHPCIDCLVFPICKSRAKENESVFNPSGMFAYLKGHCDILREAYEKHKDTKTIKAILPYSEQPFCRAVLRHFDIPYGATTHAG